MSRTTIGKYIDLEKIGVGGMAEVFIGHDDSLDRKVAIKLILPHLATAGDFEERFRREAKTVAALRHNNIIQIYEYAIEDGNPYMVMEYLENGSLEEHLTALRSKNQVMSLEEAADMLSKIASGLDYAHKRDLIHRDIKPSNILLSSDGEPIIADFGIVKMLNESVVLTQTGGVVGSPRYLPPEQASNATIDHRSDIYSLGIMLYEMVTGQVPFDGDLIAIMMQHVNEIPKNPSEINPDIPWAASSVITQALAKDPEERFASAGEMARAFKQALSGVPAAQSVPANTAISTPTFIEDISSADVMSAAPQSSATAPSASPDATLVTAPASGGIPKPVLYGGIGLVVLAIIVGGYMIFDGIDDIGNNDGNNNDVNIGAIDNSAELTEEAAGAGADTAPIATDLPSDEPTAARPTSTAFPEPWIQITNIIIEDEYYVAEYETYGYTEAMPGDHIHFFYDTDSREFGPWKMYGGPRPFKEYAVSSKPEDATQICALFAFADHVLIQDTGNCYPLPNESTSGYLLEGQWEYKLVEHGTSTNYDVGTISFSDNDTGRYILIDSYEFEYSGEFIITEEGFEIPRKGWVGSFEDADTLTGTWENDDTSGTFTVTRKPEDVSTENALEGEWEFAMVARGTTSNYDAGTITFANDTTGTFLLIDFYGYDNPGEFIITADGFELTFSGWVGQFDDADTISGTWDNGDAVGTFTATRIK